MKQAPSRRAFLRAAALGAATVAVPGLGGGIALGAVPGPAALRRNVFAPLVGTSFRVSVGGVRRRAVLVAIGDLRNARRGDPNRFRLVFAFRGALPPQGTYRFEHPRLARFPLFFVPVGSQRARHYEAVVVSA